jgi:hypothetical protein
MLFDGGYADGIIPVLAVPEKSFPNGLQAGLVDGSSRKVELKRKITEEVIR